MLKSMGFKEHWVNWMEALVCSNWMLVLVNGSHSKDVKVCRGLRRGDPLLPFLLVLVGESLSALVRKAIEVLDLPAFNIEDLCEVSILYFIEDTLLIGNGDW